MSVKKIFVTLGTIVACVILIAFVLNVILPNGVAGISNAVEDAIYSATGISIDFNGDGHGGSSSSGTYGGDVSGNGDAALEGAGVDGFN